MSSIFTGSISNIFPTLISILDKSAGLSASGVLPPLAARILKVMCNNVNPHYFVAQNSCHSFHSFITPSLQKEGNDFLNFRFKGWVAKILGLRPQGGRGVKNHVGLF